MRMAIIILRMTITVGLLSLTCVWTEGTYMGVGWEPLLVRSCVRSLVLLLVVGTILWCHRFSNNNNNNNSNNNKSRGDEMIAT
mmetsp:Transcript_5756/g.6606  ORF Transcript_5756/g.6606 Transcript_5756/m.6606 type:complete len:83 (-) Transcript_5756:1343-1591(-)